MNDEKYITLIKKLTDSTVRGTVTWRKTSGKDEFKAAVGKNAVAVFWHEFDSYRIEPEDKEEYYAISIFNSSGQEIDDYRQYVKQNPKGEISALFEAARRSYYKIDQTIDEIISELK